MPENIVVEIPDFLLAFALEIEATLGNGKKQLLADVGKTPDDLTPNVNKMPTKEEFNTFLKMYYLWLRYIYLYTTYELTDQIQKDIFKNNSRKIYGLNFRIYRSNLDYKIEVEPGAALFRKVGTSWSQKNVVFKKFSIGKSVKNIGNETQYLDYSATSPNNIMSVQQDYREGDIIYIFALCTFDYEENDQRNGIIGADLNPNGSLIAQKFKSTLDDDTDVYIRRIGSTRTYLVNQYLVAEMQTKTGRSFYVDKQESPVLDESTVEFRKVEIDMSNYLSGPYSYYKVIFNVFGFGQILLSKQKANRNILDRSLEVNDTPFGRVILSQNKAPERWITRTITNNSPILEIMGHISKIEIDVVYFYDLREQ